MARRRQTRLLENLARGAEIHDYLRISDHHQLRVLVCEGATMLAWVGLLQPEPFREEQKEVLAAVAPALARRLRLEARIERGSVAHAALQATLEALGTAAFVCTREGHPVAANAVGRRELQRGGRALRGRLREAARGRDPGFERASIAAAGAPPHVLLVARPHAGSDMAARAAARRHGLTPREQEVLVRLATGASNRRIAAALGCAERTIETHVTRILAKLEVGSRAEAIAYVLQAGLG